MPGRYKHKHHLNCMRACIAQRQTGTVPRQPQQTQDVHPMLIKCWRTICEAGPVFFIYHLLFICLQHRLAFKLYDIFQGNCLGSPPITSK